MHQRRCVFVTCWAHTHTAGWILVCFMTAGASFKGGGIIPALLIDVIPHILSFYDFWNILKKLFLNHFSVVVLFVWSHLRDQHCAIKAIVPPCGCLKNSQIHLKHKLCHICWSWFFVMKCKRPRLSLKLPRLIFSPSSGVWQKLRSFFKNVSSERSGEPFSDGATTMVWSFAVAIFSVGGMIGSFCVGFMVNKFGRWEHQGNNYGLMQDYMFYCQLWLNITNIAKSISCFSLCSH